MSFVVVKFLHDCADDRAGDVKPIDPTRAKRLERTGYIQIVEQATVTADEQAARPKPPAPRPARAERRG